MAKISFFEIKPFERAYLRRQLKQHSLKFFKEPLSEENVREAQESEIVCIFIRSKIGKKILKKLPKVKFITTRSTGFDHIDLEECRKKGIVVSNVPHYGENTVAEHTFALILSISRNIHKTYLRTLEGNFSIEGLRGFDLKGKTIGIIGGGSIGLHVAKIARGFGMKVLIYDINKNELLAEIIGFKYTELDNLLRNSDIISLHVPYNKQTHHLINKRNIKKIKRGAILINTSRGGVIDTDALLWALKNKILGGAGLDVIEGEELIKEEKELLHTSANHEKWKTIVEDLKILKMDNVVFTPHNAFNSKEALQRILATTVENIKAYLNEEPINIVW